MFKAKHSILSDTDTIESSKFKLFIGEVEPLASDDFTRELVAMLPKFLELALQQPLPANVLPSGGETLVRLPPVTPIENGQPPTKMVPITATAPMPLNSAPRR